VQKLFVQVACPLVIATPSFAQGSDTSKIAISSNQDGNLEICVMNADDSAITRLMTNLAYDYQQPWSP
jgi:Tol biopolymer transport system component